MDTYATIGVFCVDNRSNNMKLELDPNEFLPMLPPGAGINEMIGEYKLEKDVI